MSARILILVAAAVIFSWFAVALVCYIVGFREGYNKRQAEINHMLGGFDLAARRRIEAEARIQAQTHFHKNFDPTA